MTILINNKSTRLTTAWYYLNRITFSKLIDCFGAAAATWNWLLMCINTRLIWKLSMLSTDVLTMGHFDFGHLRGTIDRLFVRGFSIFIYIYNYIQLLHSFAFKTEVREPFYLCSINIPLSFLSFDVLFFLCISYTFLFASA